MTRSNVRTVWLSITAMALSTTSCIGSADPAADENVAVSAEALGGYTPLIDVGNETVMDIGPTYTIFRNQPTPSCGTIDLVLTQTGQRVSVPALPGCANITAASSHLSASQV